MFESKNYYNSKSWNIYLFSYKKYCQKNQKNKSSYIKHIECNFLKVFRNYKNIKNYNKSYFELNEYKYSK